MCRKKICCSLSINDGRNLTLVVVCGDGFVFDAIDSDPELQACLQRYVQRNCESVVDLSRGTVFGSKLVCWYSVEVDFKVGDCVNRLYCFSKYSVN